MPSPIPGQTPGMQGSCRGLVPSPATLTSPSLLEESGFELGGQLSPQGRDRGQWLLTALQSAQGGESSECSRDLCSQGGCKSVAGVSAVCLCHRAPDCVRWHLGD